MTLTAAGPPTWLLEDGVTFEDLDAYLRALPSDDHRAEVMRWVQSQNDWRRTPGTLAMRLDPTTVQTPALRLIDRAFVDAYEQPPLDNGGYRITVICLPPQEGKSTRVSRYGALWLLQRNPNLRVALVSYELDNVRRMSTAVRDAVAIYDGSDGNVDLGLRLKPGEQAANRWGLAGTAGGLVTASITGRFTGIPVDALIIDDPVKDYRAADSTLQSELGWLWWLSVGRPRLAPGAPVYLVLTRWSDLDLAGRLKTLERMNREAGVEHSDEVMIINIPAQADHDPAKGETDPLGRAPGEWLISARGRTPAQWEATKSGTLAAGGSRVFAALYQGRPAPVEGGVIKRAWFRLESFMPEPATVNEWLGSWDMKLKDKRSGDYIAGGMWARVGSHYHLMEVFRGQWDFPTVQCAVALMAVRWPLCRRILVENTGNGPEVMEELRKAKPDYEVSDDVAGELNMTDAERLAVQDLRRAGLAGLVPVNPKGSKAARIQAESGVIESGHVHLPVSAHWTAAYVDEMASFGVGGRYDDQVDMTSQALRRLNRRGARDDDEPVIKVAEGRIPPTTPRQRPQPRLPMAGRIPSTGTRQNEILRRQLGRPRPDSPGP